MQEEEDTDNKENNGEVTARGKVEHILPLGAWDLQSLDVNMGWVEFRLVA